MKILLDENIPHTLRHDLPDHDVFTVAYLGWASISNGTLLKVAAEAGFEAMLTRDRAIEHGQNLETLPLTVFALYARSGREEDVRALLPVVVSKLFNIKPRSFIIVRPEDIP